MVLVDYSITDTYTQVSVPHLSGPGSGAGLQPSSPGLVTRSWATPGAAVMTFGPGAPQGIRTVYDPEWEEFGSGLGLPIAVEPGGYVFCQPSEKQ